MEGTFNPIDDYWGTDYIAAILQAMGGGQVYLYQNDSCTFVLQNRTEFQPYYDSLGEQILVFNWGFASNDVVSGHAEAAAEALFAGMIRSGFLDPANPNSNKSFHFLGHSRGASVVSETVQRMGVYGIPVNYVTYLDPHDFDESWVPYDEDWKDPAVQVWSNVMYADNFWQTSNISPVPSGRSLDQLTAGYNYNYQLDALSGFTSYFSDTHWLVATYYQGTILPNTQNKSYPDWYTGDKTGDNTGFALWLSRGGYSYNGDTNGFNPAKPRTDPVTLTNLVPFNSSVVADSDDNYATPFISNNDFDLNVQYDGSSIYGGDLAGWSYFGGEGGATPVNNYLVLNYTSGGNTNTRTHNWIYIPKDANQLSFQYKIASASSGTPPAADKLQVMIERTADTVIVLDNIYLNKTADWQTASFSLVNFRNSVVRVKFNLAPVAATHSQVYIDNLNVLLQLQLPVELTNFTAKESGRDVEITWSTKTEISSSKFIIERKQKGLWIEIGSLNAAGNSNAPRDYKVIDKQLNSGTYAYRLKMTSNDGSSQYSDEITSKVGSPAGYLLSQNYPNPFNPSTKIDYSLPSDSKVTLEIFNILGEKVGKLVNGDQSAGYYTVDFNSLTFNKTLPSGIYIYRLTASAKGSGSDFSSVKKMVMLK